MIKIAVRRVLIGDKKNSLRPLWPKQSNLKPQTDRTSFRSHAELRRRGGFEDGDKNKTPRLRISA